MPKQVDCQTEGASFTVGPTDIEKHYQEKENLFLKTDVTDEVVRRKHVFLKYT
jgi:hypothetical protein